MPRKKKKPGYNPELSMEELLKEVSEAYGSFDDRKEERHEPSLNALAAEYDLNVLKIRKLLITAGVYSTSTSRKVNRLAKDGYSTREIVDKTGLSVASVNSYLPYDKAAYKMPERSVEADRAKIYRQRNSAIKKLQKLINLHMGENDRDSIQDEKKQLWKCVERFEGYKFKTAKELPYTYEIKQNRYGEKSGEIIFSRKSKGVTRATIELAYDRVVKDREVQETNAPIMTTPKKLNVFGASYIYGMFIRFGIIIGDSSI